MLGKTNTIFVSKNDASEMQLIQERYLTPSAGAIKKIEYLNNIFFIFTSNKEVMYGADVGELSFIKKDGKNLEATHFIYHEGKYYFCIGNKNSKLKACVYATADFTNYEEIIIEENEDENYDLCVTGLFKDSRGRIIILGYRCVDDKNIYEPYLRILSNFDNRKDEEVISLSEYPYSITRRDSGIQITDTILIKDRIFSRILGSCCCDLAGNINNLKNPFRSYANGYFYRGVYNNTVNSYLIQGIYKSFDGINWVMCNSVDIENAMSWSTVNRVDCGQEVIPVAGYTCLLYSRDDKVYINMADKTNLIGSSSNRTFELDISDLNQITAVAEDGEGNTYIGFVGGCIIKIYLDQDGTTQLPDVQVIKTLAAKQALAQAKQYTDKKVAELKAYFDSNMGQQ